MYIYYFRICYCHILFYAELEFLKNSSAKPKHTENDIHSKIVPFVQKKKRSRGGTRENVIICSYPTILPSRLPHISSSNLVMLWDILQHLVEIQFKVKTLIQNYQMNIV